MKRNILLVEPGYKTKFPPLGLMKISAYHKLLGDNVTFVKGISSKVAYKYWDRIYVTTLFTYNWAITIDTIKHYKALVKGDLSRMIRSANFPISNDPVWFSCETASAPPIVMRFNACSTVML